MLKQSRGWAERAEWGYSPAAGGQSRALSPTPPRVRHPARPQCPSQPRALSASVTLPRNHTARGTLRPGGGSAGDHNRDGDRAGDGDRVGVLPHPAAAQARCRWLRSISAGCVRGRCSREPLPHQRAAPRCNLSRRLGLAGSAICTSCLGCHRT